MKATEIPANYIGLGRNGSLRVVQVFIGDMRGWSGPCAKHKPWEPQRAVATIVDDHTHKSVDLCRDCCQDLIGFVPGPVGNQYYFGRDAEQLQSVEAKRDVESVSLEEMRAELKMLAPIAALRNTRLKRPVVGHVTPRKAVIGKIVKRRKR